MNEKTIKQNYFLSLIAMVLFALVGLGLLWTVDEIKRFSRETQEHETIYLDNQRAIIKGQVDMAVDLVARERVQAEKQLDQDLDVRIDRVVAALDYSDKTLRSSRSVRQIPEMLQQQFPSSVFERLPGYLFIVTDDNRPIFLYGLDSCLLTDQVQPSDRQLQGIIDALRRSAADSGRGTYERRAGTETRVGTYNRVRMVEPDNWLVCAGVCLDDWEDDLKHTILEDIGRIRFGQDGYIFVISYDGELLMSDYQRSDIGKNFDELPDSNAALVLVLGRQACANPEGGYISYVWQRPSRDKPSSKLSFVRGVADWSWMVGTGVYLDTLEVIRAQGKQELSRSLRNHFYRLLAVFLFVGLIAFFIARYFSHKLGREFETFSAFFKKIETSYQPIDIDRLQFQEFKDLAEPANRMAEHRMLAERELQKLNEELEHKIETRTKEIKVAYEQLKQAQAQLLQSEKMASIGQLAAGVAHEINNPIGFIKSNLSTLGQYAQIFKAILSRLETIAGMVKEGKDIHNQEVLSALADIESISQEEDLAFILKDLDTLINESSEGVQRVKEIVQNLKSFARLDETELKEADINEGLEATLKIVWNEIKYKAQVVKKFNPLPLILCYPGQLNQVFMNMLVNAAQAIEDTGEITIETEATEKEVIIRISDNGVGIPETNLPRVFEPFFTTKEVGQGTGLGLAISYGVVKKHNGAIEVESRVGQGTTFTIRLPRLTAETE